MFKEIEIAILCTDLALTPNNDWISVICNFPELTEDRRNEFGKDIKKKAENTKVAIRNIRRDANDYFKKQLKANEISEDEQKDYEDKVQKLTDKYVDKVESTTENKSKEIMTV